jgi:hypothetical protein
VARRSAARWSRPTGTALAHIPDGLDQKAAAGADRARRCRRRPVIDWSRSSHRPRRLAPGWRNVVRPGPALPLPRLTRTAAWGIRRASDQVAVARARAPRVMKITVHCEVVGPSPAQARRASVE